MEAKAVKNASSLLQFSGHSELETGLLIEINKVSNEQSQYVCKIEREVGGFKGRQV